MKRITVIFLLVAILVSSGCVSQEGSSESTDLDADGPAAGATGNEILYSANTEKVEVLHFHGNHQCQACIDVGRCAEDAVNQYFQDEQESGLVVFGHVNGQLPENAELVKKYGATGSSLWIGVYGKDGGFFKEQNINVWYKTGDMEKCREYLKEVIEEKLKGE